MSSNIKMNVFYTYRYLALLMRANNMNIKNFPHLTCETKYNTPEIHKFMKHPAIKNIVPNHNTQTLEENVKYWKKLYEIELNKFKNT
jgi:hypothetical protein